jgi:hypothetical protein
MSMTKEEVVAFLSDMIDAITWQRGGLLCILGAVTVSLIVGFDNRTALFGKIFNDPSIQPTPIVWQISETSKAELKSLTARPVVGGVFFTEVNLKQNKSSIVYWYVKNPKVTETINKSTSTQLPQALFDSDRKNNEQMLLVLNNQFKCVKTIDSSINSLIPDLKSTMPFICRLAVPPYVGDFAGFFTIALVRQPSEPESESLKIELNRLSIELYLRDIQKRGALDTQ